MSRALVLDHRGNQVSTRGGIHFSKKGASTRGAYGKWNPQAIFSEYQKDREKELFNARSTELVENDPNSAAIADPFCYSVGGRGLTPHPALDDHKALGISKKKANKSQEVHHQVF